MRTPSSAFRPQASGLTLVEILVALAVLSILVAIAAPSMGNLMERRRVIAAAEEVSGILTYAKAETNATNSMLIARFDPDPSKAMSCASVTTFGKSFSSKCKCYMSDATMCVGTPIQVLRLFQLPQTYVSFNAAATTWAGIQNQVTFSRDQMTVATDGFHVDVVGKRYGYTLRVELNAAGRVKTCSPNGDMSGYVKCA